MIKKISIIFIFVLMIFGMQKVEALTTTEYMSAYCATIRYSKNGGFTIDKSNEEYYSQEYQVYTDNAEILKCTIEILSGFPEGTFIANIDTGEEQNDFVSRENKFKIMIPKEKADKDFIGKLKISAKFRSYTTYYTEDKVLKVIESQDVNEQNVSFDNRQSTLKINITDADTSEKIEGVKIEVKDNTLDTIEKHTSDENGEIVISKISEGTASIYVLQTPYEYILENIEYSKEIGYQENAEYEIKLKHKKGKLHIENNVKDSVFEIYDSKGTLLGKYTPNENGVINIEELNIGNYLLIQKEISDEYVVMEDIKISIGENETYKLVLINELKNKEENTTEEPKEDTEEKQEGEEDNGKDENQSSEKEEEPNIENKEEIQDPISDTNKEDTNTNVNVTVNVNVNVTNKIEVNTSTASEENNKTEIKEEEKDQIKDTEDTKEQKEENNIQVGKTDEINKDKEQIEEIIKENKQEIKEESNNTNKENDEQIEHIIQEEKTEETEKVEIAEGAEKENAEENTQEDEQEEDTENDEQKVITSTLKTEVQKGQNQEVINQKVLPRTGDDYFQIKIILLNLIVFTILAIVILIKKKQTAQDSPLYHNN